MPQLHQRALIRRAFVTTLQHKTLAEERVVATRVWPWKSSELPAMSVYTLEESVDPQSARTAPRELERSLDVAIEMAVQLVQDVDDVLDAEAYKVEAAINAAEALGGVGDLALCDAVLRETVITVNHEGDLPVGLLRMVYTVRYFTVGPYLDAVDLKTVDVRYADVDGGEDLADGDQANDRVNNLDT
jgi:hypothetical protein